LQRARPPINFNDLSCDFHNHATAHLICGLFGLHDRRRFKIFGYSYGPDDNSLYRQKIRTHCDWTKEELGLPDMGFVFSSFNLPYKIDPLMFDCWMRILKQVPHSVLWLYDASITTTANLKQEAKARGIDPCRLVFGAKLSENRLITPLFDTPAFVGYLESAYQKMRTLFVDGWAPQSFEVSPD
jgi:predicted O-linked N-acetylglucosamine transferase (SPINDLY family)